MSYFSTGRILGKRFPRIITVLKLHSPSAAIRSKYKKFVKFMKIWKIENWWNYENWWKVEKLMNIWKSNTTWKIYKKFEKFMKICKSGVPLSLNNLSKVSFMKNIQPFFFLALECMLSPRSLLMHSKFIDRNAGVSIQSNSA